MGRRLGTIDDGLGWSTRKCRCEKVMGCAEQRVVVRRRRLGGGRGGALLVGLNQVGNVEWILAFLTIRTRSRSEIGGIGGPELEHDRGRRRKQRRQRLTESRRRRDIERSQKRWAEITEVAVIQVPVVICLSETCSSQLISDFSVSLLPLHIRVLIR